MSLTSAFFDAELVGGEYDRVYSAEHFAEYFAAFIANGVFPDPATNLQVVANIPSDMTVLVKPGLGWINGYYCNNDGNYSLTISPASGTLPRVDAVVLRWSRSNRSISLDIKTGTARANPVAPSLERSSDTYELMLASITVAAGATSIAQARITDKRPDSTVCGWVQGTVGQIDTTNLFAQYDDAFQTWFNGIKTQLSGNVATNLQNQINELKTGKVSVSDKATESEAKAATNDTHWMSPAKVAKAIEANTYKIGDMLKTYRTDLDNTWLPCDGSAISQALYPNLYSLLKNGNILSVVNQVVTVAKSGVLKGPFHRINDQRGPFSMKITAKPGTQAVVLETDSSDYPYVAYKQDGGDWVFIRATTLDKGVVDSSQIRYLNGRYVMVAVSNGSSSLYFAYSTNLQTWTVVRIHTDNTNIFNHWDAFHVEYTKGRYYTYYIKDAYSTNVTLYSAYTTDLSSVTKDQVVTTISNTSAIIAIEDYLYTVNPSDHKIYRITAGVATAIATYTDEVGTFPGVWKDVNHTACMDSSGNFYVTTGGNTLTIFEKTGSSYKARTYTTTITGQYLNVGNTPQGVILIAPQDTNFSSAKVAKLIDLVGNLRELEEIKGVNNNYIHEHGAWLSEDTVMVTLFNASTSTSGTAKITSQEYAVTVPSSSDSGPEYIKAKEG